MRIPATLFFGQTFRPYILLFAEIWQGSGGHVVFQNRPKINTKQAIFRLYKSATTNLWQPSKSTEKKSWQNTQKKNHGSHFINTRGGHLIFPNQPKKIPRQVFPMMNLSCKFGSSSYNILRDRKAFVKRMHARTDGRTDRGHFIISRTGPIGRREIIKFYM